MSNSVTVDPANTAAVLELVKQAEAQANGQAPVQVEEKTTPEGEAAPETKTEAAETKPEGKTPDSLEIEKPAEKAVVFSMESLAAEFEANQGKLTEETTNGLIKALETAGLENPAAWIEQFVTGQQYAGAAARQQALALVGGEQGFNAMAAWAKANVPAEELQAYNEAVTSKNAQLQKLAVQGMYARFQASGAAPKSTPTSNRVEAGANANVGGIEPVITLQQVAALTSDPRYENDAAWRAQADRRIQAGIDATKRR